MRSVTGSQGRQLSAEPVIRPGPGQGPGRAARLLDLPPRRWAPELESWGGRAGGLAGAPPVEPEAGTPPHLCRGGLRHGASESRPRSQSPRHGAERASFWPKVTQQGHCEHVEGPVLVPCFTDGETEAPRLVWEGGEPRPGPHPPGPLSPFLQWFRPLCASPYPQPFI